MAAHRISVLTTVFNPPLTALRECLQSVEDQTYPDLEHVIVDDGSAGNVAAALSPTSRRRVLRRESNGGISVASSAALSAATGEIVVLLDHDDVLTPDALAAVNRAFDADVDLVYSDHDILREDGRLVDPCYKPDFSPERLRNHNYITHLVAVRRSTLLAAGGFRSGFDGAQDHDLLLRVSEIARRVVHVPRVLYHWRRSSTSVAANTAAKPYAYEAGRRAVDEHCRRIGLAATVRLGSFDGTYSVQRVAPQGAVSIVPIGPRSAIDVWGSVKVDATRAVESARGWGERAASTVAWREASDSIQSVADELGSDFVLLLSAHTLRRQPGGLSELASMLTEPDVGACGPMLLCSDGTIHSAGLVCQSLARPILTGWPGDHPGPQRLTAVAREVGALPASVLMVRRADLCEFLATQPPLPLEDVDPLAFGVALSAWLRARRYRLIWTPGASWWYFAEPRSTTVDLAVDPYYNPNLHADRADWLELPGRSGAPPFVIDARGRRQWA